MGLYVSPPFPSEAYSNRVVLLSVSLCFPGGHIVSVAASRSLSKDPASLVSNPLPSTQCSDSLGMHLVHPLEDHQD